MRRRSLGLGLLLAGVLVFSLVTSPAGAGNKFAYTEQITDARSLAVDFEEVGLKKFAAVDYRLEASALAHYCDGGEEGALLSGPTVAFVPDSKGPITDGTLILGLPTPSGHLCLPDHIEYTNVTLTNVTTGHVYHLDSISRDYP
jgi:hypothetical protein